MEGMLVRLASKIKRPREIFRSSLAALELVDFIKKNKFKQDLKMLDIGGGHGIHADFFSEHLPGITVDIVDLNPNDIRTIFAGDYIQYSPTSPYDIIWTSHVLEHIRNPGIFLDKIRNDLIDGGVFCCTVPPHRNGRGILEHVTTWDPMLLIINLVRSGFDASNGHFAKYRYNVSAIVERNNSAVNLMPDIPKQGHTYIADFNFWNWDKKNISKNNKNLFTDMDDALAFFSKNNEISRFFCIKDFKISNMFFYDKNRDVIMGAN